MGQAPGKKYNSASGGEAFRAGETLIFTLSPAPSRRLRVAPTSLQKASRRPQRGLKMAYERSKVALRFPMIGLRRPQDGMEVPPPTMFPQSLSSAPLAFCNVCHQT